MIYPDNFEAKIGFDEVRRLLSARCLCPLGKEMVASMAFCPDAARVGEWLSQTRQWRRMSEQVSNFPLQYFFDVRQSVARLRLEGTHIEEDELFDLRRSLDTIYNIAAVLAKRGDDEDAEPLWPALARMTEDIMVFPDLVRRIDGILDKFGHIRDNASPELADIRHELARVEGSIGSTLAGILRAAQRDGLVEKDIAPTMRDGRLVIPVAPALKRRIRGIVHDESASGKTVFIEPAEVVEANNRVRELEAAERREVVRILKLFAAQVRPHVEDIVHSYQLLARVDFTRSRAMLAEALGAIEPQVEARPAIDWCMARHPLLSLSLAQQGKKVVPLDIELTQGKRMLIISGPNAGGKSVCLKTVGLLQYMVQCGLSIPVAESSHVGLFSSLMIDIGDEQSIGDDLSTYSGHLNNMKQMLRHSDGSTLLLIDEFGGGTEPQIGGAIAEAVLKQLCENGAFGVITTHYQNLKRFADTYAAGVGQAVANGAMLYDRQQMQPLFRLAIGQPGSSFAIEIARKTGLPAKVIDDAAEIVGSEYIQSDKYLQDIVRDKRYWETKRQNVHQKEKELQERIDKYEADIAALSQNRKEVLARAKAEAEELLREANRRIENTIREIREAQAEREQTKKAREELAQWNAAATGAGGNAAADDIDKKMRQIEQRKERRERRKREKAEAKTGSATPQTSEQRADKPLAAGDTVRIRGTRSVGTIETIDGKTAMVVFGDMRTKMPAERLERAKAEAAPTAPPASAPAKGTRQVIDDRKANFHQDLDVRGMRAEEALNAVTYFIDDAVVVGMPRVRILHGTGTGALRQAIRQWLGAMPIVQDYHDEHVQFGGTGITVVDL